MSKISDIELNKFPAKLAATVLGCSDKHLLRMVKKGEIKQTARGKYNLPELVRYFINKSPDGMTPLQAATLQEKLEKSRKDRLANDEKENLLVSVADVQEFTHEYAGLFVQTFEASKKRVGALLDNSKRKMLNEQFVKSREELTTRLEAFKRRCSRTDETFTD